MTDITAAHLRNLVQRQMDGIANLKPPLDMEEQLGFIFSYRNLMQIALLLVEELDERDRHIGDLLAGNETLNKILEDWISDMQEKDAHIEYLTSKVKELTELAKRNSRNG